MQYNMTRTDAYILLGAIILSLLAGIAVAGVTDIQVVVMLTLGLTGLAAVTITLALIAIYRGRKPYGGQVARNLEIVGLGLALFIVTYLPHVVWHVLGLMENNPLGPAWGLGSAWWAGFFHVGAMMFFLTSTYGFYLFWKIE